MAIRKISKTRGITPGLTRQQKHLYHIINALSLPELIEVSDIIVARRKGMRYISSQYPQAEVIARKIERVSRRSQEQGLRLINQVNHAIVIKNQTEYKPSAKARMELQNLMEDDE